MSVVDTTEVNEIFLGRNAVAKGSRGAFAQPVLQQSAEFRKHEASTPQGTRTLSRVGSVNAEPDDVTPSPANGISAGVCSGFVTALASGLRELSDQSHNANRTVAHIGLAPYQRGV